MSEQELNDAGLFVEQYGGGFMLADYRDGANVCYYGSDLSSRRQPITYRPFADRESAIKAGESFTATRV